MNEKQFCFILFIGIELYYLEVDWEQRRQGLPPSDDFPTWAIGQDNSCLRNATLNNSSSVYGLLQKASPPPLLWLRCVGTDFELFVRVFCVTMFLIILPYCQRAENALFILLFPIGISGFDGRCFPLLEGNSDIPAQRIVTQFSRLVLKDADEQLMALRMIDECLPRRIYVEYINATLVIQFPYEISSEMGHAWQWLNLDQNLQFLARIGVWIIFIGLCKGCRWISEEWPRLKEGIKTAWIMPKPRPPPKCQCCLRCPPEIDGDSWSLVLQYAGFPRKQCQHFYPRRRCKCWILCRIPACYSSYLIILWTIRVLWLFGLWIALSCVMGYEEHVPQLYIHEQTAECDILRQFESTCELERVSGKFVTSWCLGLIISIVGISICQWSESISAYFFVSSIFAHSLTVILWICSILPVLCIQTLWTKDEWKLATIATQCRGPSVQIVAEQHTLATSLDWEPHWDPFFTFQLQVWMHYEMQSREVGELIILFLILLSLCFSHLVWNEPSLRRMSNRCDKRLCRFRRKYKQKWPGPRQHRGCTHCCHKPCDPPPCPRVCTLP